jgi:hypothetical protein
MLRAGDASNAIVDQGNRPADVAIRFEESIPRNHPYTISLAAWQLG